MKQLVPIKTISMHLCKENSICIADTLEIPVLPFDTDGNYAIQQGCMA